jgi:hypothetical protein
MSLGVLFPSFEGRSAFVCRVKQYIILRLRDPKDEGILVI